MKLVEALHTAARRYCINHAREWEERYAVLQPGPPIYGYPPEALDTFPRYNVLHAIQAAVEATTPAGLGSLEEARERLATTGANANDLFTQPPYGEIEQKAMEAERALFSRYVFAITPEELVQVEPLPFRRTLIADESAAVWHELERRWGAKGYLYPLDRPPDAVPPPHTEAFDAESFFTASLQHRLREVLKRLGVEKVWELHEGVQPDAEIELSILEPIYTGDEGVWTDSSFDWFVYASHESSVTVAGERLLPAMQQAWPEWRSHLYDRSG